MTSSFDPRVETLLKAQAERHEIERIDPLNQISEDEAYRLQFMAIDYKRAQGDRVVGLKTGLTSKAKQETMGIHQPIMGHIMASSVTPEGRPVACAGLIHPRAEPEIALRMARDLIGPVEVAEARAAVESVFAAVEIIDSRFKDFKFGLADVIADNTSAAGVVFGTPQPVPADQDLRLLGMAYSRNGELVATAAGAAILGDPWQALVWLANRATELGRPLLAGHYVLAGALTDALFVAPGDELMVEFDYLGALRVAFT